MVSDKDVMNELHELELKMSKAMVHGLPNNEKLALAQDLNMLIQCVRHRFSITSAYWISAESVAEKLFFEKYAKDELFK